MCTILKFAPATSNTGDKVTCGERRASAEVIIFPGVRYERTAASDGNVRRSGRSDRDYLEL